MPVVPIHYFVFHPQGKLKGTNPPGGSGGLTQNSQAQYPYTVACKGLDSDKLPKQVTVETACVTCAKCKETEIFKQNFKPISPVGEDGDEE